MKISEIIAAIETVAPLRLQESYDNSGLQTGHPDQEATGVILCVDPTEEILLEAERKGCNLVISHHPLLFHGVKCVSGRNRPERVLEMAIRKGITIYSSHTALDSSTAGISRRMAAMLGLRDVKVLVPQSPGSNEELGAVGNLPHPIPAEEFLQTVKSTFGCRVLRVSSGCRPHTIGRVALCGGSAGEFVPEAIAAGAEVYITADCKHNQFLDHSHRILLVDAGHFETEECSKQIFLDILTEKFHNFAVWKSESEQNPIIYL